MVSGKASHFEKDIMLSWVRQQVAYPLSYRQLEEGGQGRGVAEQTLRPWNVPQLSLAPSFASATHDRN